jgi:hypothetical protein
LLAVPVGVSSIVSVFNYTFSVLYILIVVSYV